MESVYRNFYRDFYRRTNGFIPVAPLGQAVYPGDFFQLRDGQMYILGNIFRNHIIDPKDTDIGYTYKLNPAGWSFSEGVTKPYAGRGSGHGPVGGAFEFSKQVLAFAARGNFIFKANDPESVRILNWNAIEQALIIRMTQTYYSFRNVYIVTECVTAADWTLAISGGGPAELEIATDAENFGLVDLFGHPSSRTIQSKDIEYYHREDQRTPSFYKARKLVVSEEKTAALSISITEQRRGHHAWARSFYDYDFHDAVHQYNPDAGMHSHAQMLDLLQANELNPNTALLYFNWAEASLDDVEKLFIG